MAAANASKSRLSRGFFGSLGSGVAVVLRLPSMPTAGADSMVVRRMELADEASLRGGSDLRSGGS